jgi:hypothetical protein
VPDLAFDRQRRGEIDLVGMRAQVVDFCLRHEARELLRLRQRNPNRAPQLAAFAFGEELAERRACVAPGERRGVRGIVHG